MAFRPVNLRFEHHLPTPGSLSTVGIGESRPRISWRLENTPGNFEQAGYHLEIRRPGEAAYSEEIHGTGSTLVPWPESQVLRSREGAHVRVKVPGQTTSEWSEWHYVEAGLLSRSDWSCSRISHPSYTSPETPSPSALFHKIFEFNESVKKARVYVTAQGVYDLRINGRAVSKDFMNPGWTNYHHRTLYQVYDVSEALKSGINHVTIELAEGWFTGRLGWGEGVSKFYGERNAIMAQLEIEHADGSHNVVNTDGSWQVTRGASSVAEIYDGQTFDARRAKLIRECLENDSGAGFGPVEVLDPLPETTELEAMDSAPVRQIEIVTPIKQFATPSGKTILDFGQNLVGYERIKHVAGPDGHAITLKFAEVMENEELGTRPLRCAKATDHFILAGTGEESWEPNFTFHGFRYIQIENWPGSENLMEAIEAVVIHTDMAPTASFSCSNNSLNQLHRNITWSMKGNFTGLPTDCPQRDERLGWTGDIAVFSPTATFLYDCTALLKSWLKDLWIDQRDVGGIPPVVVPNCLQKAELWEFVTECAIWNDAAVLVPWALYRETGDLGILAAQFESMGTYLRSIPMSKNSHTSALWSDDSFQLGDWLDPLAPPDNPMQCQTDAHLVANAFLIKSLSIMAEVCALLDKSIEACHFDDWRAKARSQFRRRYVTEAGLVVSDSQTAYALTIVFDLLDEDEFPAAGARLAHLVRKNNFRISTGFAGTPYVLEALTRTGSRQVAYRMLLETKCPSWLYPITMGATTTWERWDSVIPDGSINPGEMTSFNHYALGAVGQFLHERVGGLICTAPGWRECKVQPLPGGKVTKARVEHVAIHGRIGAEWEVVDGVLKVKAWVPAGTVMLVVLPERGHIMVGAGTWRFEEAFGGYEWPPERITGLPNGLALDEIMGDK